VPRIRVARAVYVTFNIDGIHAETKIGAAPIILKAQMVLD
jgi:hypothetical protein